MGNELELKKPFHAQDAGEVDAILRKMAKRALPDLGVRQAAGAAKEQSCDEEATRRLIQLNFRRGGRLRQARDARPGAGAQ